MLLTSRGLLTYVDLLNYVYFRFPSFRRSAVSGAKPKLQIHRHRSCVRLTVRGLVSHRRNVWSCPKPPDMNRLKCHDLHLRLKIR